MSMSRRGASPRALRCSSTRASASSSASTYAPDAARASASLRRRAGSSGLVGESGAGRGDAAGRSGLGAEREFGLDRLGLGLQVAARLQRLDQRAGLVVPAEADQHAGQADPGRVVRPRFECGAVERLGRGRVGRLQPAGLGQRLLGGRRHRAGRARRGSTTRAGHRRSRRPPGRRGRRRPRGSNGRRTATTISGRASVSALASTNLPAYSVASASSTGPSARHGAHHSAQKSTTTGRSNDRSITSRSNVSAVTSIIKGGLVSLMGTSVAPPIFGGKGRAGRGRAVFPDSGDDRACRSHAAWGLACSP